MNLVREHINFERGLDPKEAMGIGENMIKNMWEFGAENGVGAINIGHSKYTYLQIDYYGQEDFKEILYKYFNKDFFESIAVQYPKGKFKLSWRKRYFAYIKNEYVNLFQNIFDEKGFIKES